MININSSLPTTGIYKITSPSDKIYVGQSTNIYRRFKQYGRMNCKSQSKLYNSFRKYGPENHKFEIIEECSEIQLIERETYWKYFYNTIKNGLNCREDGVGGKLSPETCLKISQNSRGISRGKGVPKSVKGTKGIKRSEEFKNKIRNSRKNKKHSPETKKKISKSKCRSVLQYDLKGNFIQEWSSSLEIEKELRIFKTSITACCRGKLKTSGKFIWKYKEFG